MFWIGLIAAVRGRELPCRVVAVLFQVITMLVIIVTTFAHHYFQQTGATLDYGTIAERVTKLDEVGSSLFQREVPLSARVLLATTLLYMALGPPLLTRAVGRWRRWPRASPSVTTRTSFSSSLVLFLLAIGSGSLSWFDLSEGPLKERNLAGERDKKELDERCKELLAWASRLDAEYADIPTDGTTLYSNVSREE